MHMGHPFNKMATSQREEVGVVFANTDSLPFPVALASQPFEDEGSVSEFGLQFCFVCKTVSMTLHRILKL